MLLENTHLQFCFILVWEAGIFGFFFLLAVTSTIYCTFVFYRDWAWNEKKAVFIFTGQVEKNGASVKGEDTIFPFLADLKVDPIWVS